MESKGVARSKPRSCPCAAPLASTRTSLGARRKTPARTAPWASTTMRKGARITPLARTAPPASTTIWKGKPPARTAHRVRQVLRGLRILRTAKIGMALKMTFWRTTKRFCRHWPAGRVPVKKVRTLTDVFSIIKRGAKVLRRVAVY